MMSSLKRNALCLLAIIISGICWYYGEGLSGRYWYLEWIAPIPVLICALNASAVKGFFIVFFASLIGRLGWFSYLESVITMIPALIVTLSVPFFLSVIVIVTRWIVLRNGRWYSIFVFPVLITAYEFISFTWSQNGTFGSLAYTQMNFLPVIQIASVTGIFGITFLLTLFHSLIALGYFYSRKFLIRDYLPAVIVFSAGMLFGFIRLIDKIEGETLTAGLVVLDEKLHYVPDNPDFDREVQWAASYMEAEKTLAKQGATLIVLPERALNIGKANEQKVISLIREAAISVGVTVVSGYTNYRNEKQKNSLLVINEDGAIAGVYDKIHLVPGLENRFTPGKETGIFVLGKMKIGTPICKDLDFQNDIRRYGRKKTDLLVVPAWDFVADAWMHSRMAILRGVENGCSVIRTARLGRLTISDALGRVVAEKDASQGMKTFLTGRITIERRNTLYSATGEWFGIFNIFLALLFIVYRVLPQRQVTH